MPQVWWLTLLCVENAPKDCPNRSVTAAISLYFHSSTIGKVSASRSCGSKNIIQRWNRKLTTHWFRRRINMFSKSS